MSAQESIQHEPQTSLQSAIAALIRREVAVFLVFSLIFGVPLTCQQHDMMSILDLEMHHDGLVVPHEHHTHISHATTGEPEFDLPSVSPVAAALAALSGIVPSNYLYRFTHVPEPLVTSKFLLPEQTQPIPPEQPPRHA